ncbi:hypothetical protein ACFSC4_14885 [Deinococcus malanensis]|uniref:hypothetical protein n=1 Tax=Deinococcus malanensis TaxID=1706855 RepID=UPI0036443426
MIGWPQYARPPRLNINPIFLNTSITVRPSALKVIEEFRGPDFVEMQLAST